MAADLFAVVATATLDAQRVKTFLDMAYQRARQFDCGDNLFLVDSFEDLKSKAATKLEATPPSVSRAPQPIEMPLEVIAREVQIAADRSPMSSISRDLFVVLNELSAREDNALIVQVKGHGVKSVRVHSDTVVLELTRIGMITFDIGETIDLAKGMSDGVFRAEPRQRGGPASRKKLGG